MTLVRRRNYFPTVSNLFDNFFKDGFLSDNVSDEFTLPAINVNEKENSYQIEVAVPGLKKEDFNVEVNENILTVSSEKKAETEQKEEGRYTRREFHYSTFSRSFTLPKNVDAEKIEANYSEGILSIHLPKLGEVKQPTKNITIK